MKCKFIHIILFKIIIFYLNINNNKNFKIKYFFFFLIKKKKKKLISNNSNNNNNDDNDI